MAASVMLPSFTAGELSPNLYARVDLDKYHSGVSQGRNMFVDYRGGMSNRPGTKFLAKALSNIYSRIIPFIVSRDVSYIVEFAHLQLRIFANGVPVATLTAPWADADIWGVKFVQSADVMTLTHPSYPPYSLNRTTVAGTFTLTAVSVGSTIDPPGQPTCTPSVVSAVQSYVYGITAIDKNGQESVVSYLSEIGSAVLDPGATPTPKTISLSWTGSTGAKAYNIYKAGPTPAGQAMPTVLGYIGQAVVTNFTDNNIGPDFSITPPQHLDPWSPGQISTVDIVSAGVAVGDYTVINFTGAGTGAKAFLVAKSTAGIGTVIANSGSNYTPATTAAPAAGSTTLSVTVDQNNYYPACTAYFQQRQCFAGATASPDTIVMSKTGHYFNFDVSPSVLDSDAITVNIASREVNNIQHMVPMATGLIVFTRGNAYLVTGGGSSAAVTPTNISATPQASTGAGNLPPIVVNYNILFQQYEGCCIRDMTYQWTTSSYFGADRSMLANHLFFEHTLVDWALAWEPYHLVHVVRDDGKMLVMAYVPEQEVYGWTTWDTQGEFLSVATVPEGGKNVLYAVVRRYIPATGWTNYIERFADREDCCVYEDWFLDSAVTLPQTVGNFPVYLSAGSGSNVSLYSYDPATSPVSGTQFYSQTYRANGAAAPLATFQEPNVNRSIGFAGPAVDVYNNFWRCEFGFGGSTECAASMIIYSVNTAGTQLNSYSGATLFNNLCTYIIAHKPGLATWLEATNSGLSDAGFATAVFSEGGVSYLVVHTYAYQLTGGNFYVYDVCALYTIASDGSLSANPAGVTWGLAYDSRVPSGEANGYLMQTNKIDLAGMKTFNDDILVSMHVGTLNVNAVQAHPVFVRFPPINQIIGKCQPIQQTRYLFSAASSASGNTLFDFGARDMSLGIGVNAGLSVPTLFFMPGTNGETDILAYINHTTMQANTICGLIPTLKATYPTGVMVKASMPTGPGWSFIVVDPTYSASSVVGTPAANPNCFVSTAGASYTAFSDSWDYYPSAANTQTINDYFPVPYILRKEGNNFIVAWYHPYFTDPTYISGTTNFTIKEKLRVQSYNPVTGLFTDLYTLDFASVVASTIGTALTVPAHAPYCVIDPLNWAAIEVNGVLSIWHRDSNNINTIAEDYTWMGSVATRTPVVGDTYIVNANGGGCGEFVVTGVTNNNHLVGTISGDLTSLVLPDDSSTLYPVEPYNWSYVTPSATIPGMGHLEGKAVWALADGQVYGPYTVTGGKITLSVTAAAVVAGLKFTSQFKTLRLDAGEPTVQGRRKIIQAVTMRVKCSVGFVVGTDDYTTLYQPKTQYPSFLGGPTEYQAYTQGSGVAAAPFTGDIRLNVQSGWESDGVITVEQNLPLPLTILGIIPEVTVGDTQR